MKIVLVTGSTSSMGVINWLYQQQLLKGVAIQQVLNEHNPGMKQWLNQQGIEQVVVDRQNLETDFFKWVKKLEPDIVIVYGFSFILSNQFFDLAKFGFYNIHFSLLPAYKGPSPVFWQLRNGEKMSGVSIHRMTKKADSGVVLVQMPYQISEQDTLGLLHVKLSDLVIPSLHQFLQLQLFAKEDNHDKPVFKLTESYQKRPETADIRINWKIQSASQILSLVNAANPVYQGACTFYKGMEVRILQVTIIEESRNTEKEIRFNPGEVLSENEALIVRCQCGNSVEIEIVATSVGVMTGKKWKEVFIKKTDQSKENIFS